MNVSTWWWQNILVTDLQPYTHAHQIFLYITRDAPIDRTLIWTGWILLQTRLTTGQFYILFWPISILDLQTNCALQHNAAMYDRLNKVILFLCKFLPVSPHALLLGAHVMTWRGKSLSSAPLVVPVLSSAAPLTAPVPLSSRGPPVNDNHKKYI